MNSGLCSCWCPALCALFTAFLGIAANAATLQVSNADGGLGSGKVEDKQAERAPLTLLVNTPTFGAATGKTRCSQPDDAPLHAAVRSGDGQVIAARS